MEDYNDKQIKQYPPPFNESGVYFSQVQSSCLSCNEKMRSPVGESA